MPGIPVSERSPPDVLIGNSPPAATRPDRKSTRLNSSHLVISYAVFCLKKKNNPPFLTYPTLFPLLRLFSRSVCPLFWYTSSTDRLLPLMHASASGTAPARVVQPPRVHT